MKRVPGVSTISTGPTLNPGGCRLTEITKDKRLGAMDPRVEGQPEKPAQASQPGFAKRGTTCWEKARVYRSRFPETWVAIFLEDLRRVCALRNARLNLAVELLYLLQQQPTWVIRRKPFDTTIILKGRSGIVENTHSIIRYCDHTLFTFFVDEGKRENDKLIIAASCHENSSYRGV